MQFQEFLRLFQPSQIRRFKLLSSRLGQNTSWMMLGSGGRLVFQAAYFVLIARNLGPVQYGSFVAVAAAAAIVSPFVGNGGGSLMIKHVAQGRGRLAEAFGNLLFVTLISGLLLYVLLTPACAALLPRSIPLAAIVMILASDLLVTPYVNAAAAAFWSVERLGWTAALNALVTLMRLVGIVVLVELHRPTLLAWSIAYLAASLFCALVGIGCALWFLGAPRLDLRRAGSEIREGFYFASGLAAQTIYNDIDKTMLARMSTLGSVGIYGAAYRLIDVAFVPVTALLGAAYPGFFRQGKQGLQASLQYGQGLLRRALPYPLVAVAALAVFAPIVPMVLGHGYAQAVEAIRWLALLPLLKTLHYFVANSLAGAGFQGLRTLVQIGIAAFNILINLWLIPLHGWRGAAWSSLASDGLLALGLWLAAHYLTRHGSNPPQRTEPIAASQAQD